MDLLSHLKAPTETKPAPSATIDPAQGQPIPPTQNFGNNIVLEPAPAPAVAPVQTAAHTEEEFIQSGKALAAMTDQIQSGLFIFLATKKLNSKLTEAEKKVLIDAEKGVQSAEYESVDAKFQKWLTKLEKVKAQIPFNPDERLQIEDAFTHYCRITGKAMPPELIIALNGISVISKRAIDVLSF